jgi:arsenate reductase
MGDKKRVLFVCTHNSARSQMAEGLLANIYSEKFEAYSAGTVATKVNPFAIKVMAEIGIDISSHRSKSIEEFKGEIFDYVITVCDHANETCPFFPGKVHIHRNFEDPSNIKGTDEEKLEAFRKARDEIKEWINDFFSNKIQNYKGEFENFNIQ